MPRAPRAVPAWLAHPFRWQRLPVPWSAVVRGALCAGPLLGAGIATGHPVPGVLTGLGSMMAGVNDRPGTRRTGMVHIGLPALACGLGTLIGASLQSAHAGWWTVPALCAVAFVSGVASVAGPVRSTAGMQMLATAVLGAGMPLPGAPWAKSLYVLAGCAWLLLLRLMLRSPRPPGGPLGGERTAVAAVFDALADALTEVGGEGAEPARRRLTSALDRADEALRLRRLTDRLLRRAVRTEEVLLAERLAAATALCEASVALLWEGRPLPAAVAESPRRFAAALRTGEAPGRLSAPANSSAARGAFDRALLAAAVVFARSEPSAAYGAQEPREASAPPEPSTPYGSAAASMPYEPSAQPAPTAPPAPVASPPTASGPRRPGRWHALPGRVRGFLDRRTRRGRDLLGPAARDYGLRVAVCIGASTAVALLLHPEHWYWLPATATFLVKPDLGPLFSRTVNRFAGTVAGVLVFALGGAVLPGSWWPALAAGIGGAVLPFATRHFALQTSAITFMVLAFVWVGGDPQAAGERIADTAIACGIVLVVGHLPRLADPRRRIAQRAVSALHATEAFLRHVLAAEPGAGTTAERLALRRNAYHALGQARTAAETAAAELLAARDRSPDWPAILTAAERIVDAATAAAIRIDHGARRPSPEEAARLGEALSAMAGALADPGHRLPHLHDRPVAPVPDCATLTDVAAELERMRGHTGTV
ncbi:FUSC family protein [Streptomyces benahoarensis]|uniref:FUSC family protein n=1 Tax=Streptomyces benahoarensis TaxID=2595054 RepID=A0A553Z987_9ACTN|nr:FUSC family protein [Streptomyces benahoarensis]TSB19710.1 FUSC family protein [Streptomyces benahoarensis]TSB38010.1 FUSC family protein [Streptomyces benahoarensis]